MDETLAVDFETYYDPRCSIRNQTVQAYASHPNFQAYLVTIWSPSFEFAGHPTDFDWSLLEGRKLVSHNASFDEGVCRHLIDTGVIPDFKPASWDCSADLCVYHQYPRSLAGAAFALWGMEVDKSLRDRLKGHDWASIVAQGWEDETIAYGLADSKICWQIWEELSPEWPELERKLSGMTRKMGAEGVRIDRKSLKSSISDLRRQVFDLQEEIPWASEFNEKTKTEYKPTSTKGLAWHCRRLGIDPPSSTAEGDESRIRWEHEHGSQHDFLRKMTDWRKANRTLKILSNLKERMVGEDVMPFQLKYFGAEVTGRWSGGGGLNVQNLPREESFGVNVRSMLIPREGNKFIISDLSQIEPRCLALLAGDDAFLEGISQGISPYQVHAMASMDWTGGDLKSEDPNLYNLAKARTLSLGYGASWTAFIQQAANFGLSECLEQDVSREDTKRFERFLEKRHRRTGGQEDHFLQYQGLSESERNAWVNSWLQVLDYRQGNPKVSDLWYWREKEFKRSSSERNCGSTYAWQLPSGRKLRYFNIHRKEDRWVCFTQKPDSNTFSRVRSMWGSKLVENATQALARCVFGECLERIDDQGLTIRLHVHDEVIVECPEDEVERTVAAVEEAMTISPDWAPNLPVACESKVADHYLK